MKKQVFNDLNPIPPKSIIKWETANDAAPEDDPDIGKLFRVGYYSKQDGLDVIWLVNDNADYEQTIDHEYLAENFEIIEISDETDFHGVERDILKSLKLN